MALSLINYFYFLFLIAGTVTARNLPRAALGPNDVDKETVLPGRSGWERNSQGQTDIKYGDDFLPGHMRHLQRNQAKYPSNKDYMPLKAPGYNNNRDVALHNIPPASPHPLLGYRRVRDEKLPNMLDNPNHKSQTTVEYREKKESTGEDRPDKDHTGDGARQHSGTDYVGENGLLSASRSAIDNSGGQRLGRLVANPGWLKPDRNQRLGHEAPGRLESTPRPKDPPGNAAGENDDKGKKKAKAKQRDETPDKGKAVIADDASTPQSHTRERKAGDKTLRPKQSGKTLGVQQIDPLTPAPKNRKGRNGQLGSNLQDGTPGKTPGRVWSSGGGKYEVPSHLGAPVQGIRPESRVPPRPQDLTAYKKQLAENQRKEDARGRDQNRAQQGAFRLSGELAEKHHGNQHYLDNLARFNKDHPVMRVPGKVSEAPARLVNEPPANRQHPAHVPVPVQDHVQEPWTPNRASISTTSRPQDQQPSAPLALRPHHGTGTQGTGSGAVQGPSTPPRGPEPPPSAPRRSTRERKGRKKLRRRWIDYALENEILDKRDFYYLF